MTPVRITQKTLSGGDYSPFGSHTLQNKAAVSKPAGVTRCVAELGRSSWADVEKPGQALVKIKELLTICTKGDFSLRLHIFIDTRHAQGWQKAQPLTKRTAKSLKIWTFLKKAVCTSVQRESTLVQNGISDC
jgi:hypothetical protein